MSTDRLVRTRTTLHAIAENILAGHQRRVTGKIRLQVRPGGFATLALPGRPSRLAVDGAELVAEPDGLRIPIRGSYAALAAALDVEYGMPDPPYEPATTTTPEDEAVVEPEALAEIVAAWTDGDAALRAFGSDRPGYEEPVLWPEHLDVAITLGDVNYGVSPSDGYSADPYAYVGPWALRVGDFWNAPFGASRPLGELGGVDGIVAFFAEGAQRAAEDATAG